jgi:TolB-like protein
MRAKKERLAVVDFADGKGQATPAGRFLAEELATQLLMGGELQLVDRRLLSSTMKKHRVEALEPSVATKAKRVAKAVRADLFVVGSYTETAAGLLITTKLLAAQTGQSIGAARGTIPKTGPLAELLKPTVTPSASVERVGPSIESPRDDLSTSERPKPESAPFPSPSQSEGQAAPPH